MLREVVQVTQQVLQGPQMVVRQLEDGGPEERAVMLDRLTGDLQHPVVETVGHQGVRERAEKELNTKR